MRIMWLEEFGIWNGIKWLYVSFWRGRGENQEKKLGELWNNMIVKTERHYIFPNLHWGLEQHQEKCKKCVKFNLKTILVVLFNNPS